MKTLFFMKLVLIGLMIAAFGIVFKIMHWPYLDWIILLSSILVVGGTIITLIKLLNHPDVKKFFNK